MAKPTPLTTPARIRKALEMLGNAHAVGFDTESIGPSLRNAGSFINIHKSTMMGFSFAFDDGTSFYAPMTHRETASQKNIHYATAEQLVKALFRVPEMWSHNAKHDYQTLKLAGYTTRTGNWLDSNVASWLARGGKPGNGLKERIEDIFGDKREGFNPAFYGTLPSEAAPYACQDAIDTLRLGQHYQALLSPEERAWFWKYESPVVFPVGDMEMTGILFDESKLSNLDKACRDDQARIEEEFGTLTDGKVRIGSTKDLQTFFERGHWPFTKKRKAGYAIDREALDTILDHPRTTPVGLSAAKLILEHRKVTKILSTYTYPLIEMAKQYPDGRLHTSLNPRGAGTGRFTSKNPNSQNFPARGELAKIIRQCFIAPPGKKLMGADLSQIEYRLLAHLCGGEMRESYLSGEDLHDRTAKIMDCSRDNAKTVNFCRIYGGREEKVYQILGRRVPEALRALDRFLEANVLFDEDVAQALSDRQPDPFVRTICGRRKDLFQPGSPTRVFRQAKNAIIQGSAADVMKVGIVNMAMERTSAVPVTTIHDEIIYEVDDYEGADLRPTLEQSMTTMPEAWNLSVPLVAEAKYGNNWLEIK